MPWTPPDDAWTMPNDAVAVLEPDEIIAQADPRKVKRFTERASLLSRTPPLGVGEHVTAFEVRPEDRDLFSAIVGKQYATDQSMKKAGYGTQLATSFVQGAIDATMPIAKMIPGSPLKQLDPDQERYRQQLVAIREGTDPAIQPDTNVLGRTVQQTARMAYPMVQSVSAGKALGLGAGLAGAGKTGVNVATAVGTSGSFLPQTADQTYSSLIGEGVDPDRARVITAVSAPVEAAIESILPDPFSGYGAAFRGTARQVAGRLLKQYTVNYTKELTEEGLQAIVNETALEVGRRMGADIPDKGLGNILMRGVTEVRDTALPLALMTAPGGAVATAANIQESRSRPGRLAELQAQRAATPDEVLQANERQQTLTNLQAIITPEKPWVTSEEGRQLGFTEEEMTNRRTRTQALKSRIAELQNAGTIPAPEAEVREEQGGPDVRGVGQEQIQPEPAGEVSPAPEVQVEPATVEPRTGQQSQKNVAGALPAVPGVPSEQQVPEANRQPAVPVGEAGQQPAAPAVQPAAEQPSAPAGSDAAPPARQGQQFAASPILEVPLEKITLSEDVPNFKKGANDRGVVEGEQLQGKYERVPANPIVLWERQDGRLEVITGRHRLDLAKRTGEKTIPSQIVRESEGFTKQQAYLLDAESNIRDEKGSINDFATYFRNAPGLTEEEARSRGLLSRAAQRTAFGLGKHAEDNLYGAWKNGRISADKAAAIASAAPGDDGLQTAVITRAKDLSADELASLVRQMKANAGQRKQSQGDLFGFDDSAMREMESMSKAASKIKDTLKDRILAVAGALRRPEQAKDMGLSGDMESIQGEANRLRDELARWEKWETDPELAGQVRRQVTTGEPVKLPEAPAAPAPKQGAMFDKRGEPGQMNAFDDVGVPDELVVKPAGESEATQKQPESEEQPKIEKPPKKGRKKPKGGGGGSSAASKPADRPDIVPQPGSASGAMLQPVQTPELYQIAKELMGKGPLVKKLGGAAGRFKGMEGIGPLAVLIDPKTAKDEQALGQTLAHEIGHLIDFIPENTLKRGNLLGRLQSLRDFFKSTMPALDKKDQRRLRQEARKAAGKGATKDQIDAVYQKMVKDKGLLANSVIRGELLELTKWWSGDWAGAKDSYAKYRQSSRELYAEALSVFLNSPGDLEARAPVFYKALLENLNAKPEVLAAYSTLQQMLNGTGQELAESRTQTLRDMFGRAEEHINSLRVANEQQKKSAWAGITDFLGQYFLTSGQPVFTKLGRKPIKRGESAEASAARYALDELFTIDSPNHTFLRGIDEQVYQPLIEAFQQGGRDRKAAEAEANFTIGEYLYHWRVANERDSVANPAGFTATPSKSQLDAIKARIGGAAYSKLQKLAGKFHDLVYAITEQAVEEGVYNRKTFDEVITPNKDSYSAFRVTHYIDNPDVIATGVIKQVGTFSDIQNPFHATVLKAVRLNRLIEINRAKNRVRTFLEKQFPADIQPVETVFAGEGRPRIPARRPGKGKEHLIELVDGKPTYFEVPKEIAKSFSLHDIGGLGRLAAIMNSATYKVFHPLFVVYNAGFAAANPFRDLRRTWVNLGATNNVSLLKVVSEWFKALPTAYRRQIGIEDSVIREMIDNHALDVPYQSVAAEGIDSEIDQLFQKYNLREKQKPLLQKIPVIGKMLEFIEHAGALTETATKVAGWRVLEQAGVPVQERSYRVRKYVGTPDFKQRGLATALTNSTFMYSRVRWNALQADGGLATNPDTAAGWWWRQMINVIMPTTVARLAAYGVLGATIRAMFGVSDDDDESVAGKAATWTDESGKRVATYFLTDYDVLPLGVNQDGKAVFITIPRDDLGKFIARTWWHAMDLAQLGAGGELREGKTTREVVGSMFSDVKGELLPSFSPPIEITSKWLQYGAGINPIDSFYNQQIVPRKEWAAGGWQADSKMIAWTLDKFGAPGAVVHYSLSPLLGESFETGTSGGTEAVMKTAGSMTGLSRFLRVSDSGLTSDQWAMLENADQEEAAFRLSLPEAARDATSRRYFLMRREMLGDELSAQENDEQHGLNLFYHAAYLPLRKMLKEPKADAKALRADMEKAAADPKKLWSDPPASIAEDVESYKQNVVWDAVASPPDRKRYKAAPDVYEQKLKEYTDALAASQARLKYFGPSHEEAQQLLVDHQRRPSDTGKIQTERQAGNSDKLDPGYVSRAVALAKLYGESDPKAAVRKFRGSEAFKANWERFKTKARAGR